MNITFAGENFTREWFELEMRAYGVIYTSTEEAYNGTMFLDPDGVVVGKYYKSGMAATIYINPEVSA